MIDVEGLTPAFCSILDSTDSEKLEEVLKQGKIFKEIK
jgi:hypothetical protein